MNVPQCICVLFVRQKGVDGKRKSGFGAQNAQSISPKPKKQSRSRIQSTCGMVLLVVFRATKRYREHHHTTNRKKNEVKILCVLCVCRHIVCSLVSNVRSKNEGFIFSLDSVPSGPNAHVKDLVRNNNNKNADQKWTNTLEKFNKCNFYFLFIL